MEPVGWHLSSAAGSGARRWGEVASPSQDHLRRDVKQQVVIPPPYLQQQWGLGQHRLLQLTRVCQRAPVDLDDDVAILDAPSAKRRDTWSPQPIRPGPCQGTTGSKSSSLRKFISTGKIRALTARLLHRMKTNVLRWTHVLSIYFHTPGGLGSRSGCSFLAGPPRARYLASLSLSFHTCSPVWGHALQITVRSRRLILTLLQFLKLSCVRKKGLYRM